MTAALASLRDHLLAVALDHAEDLELGAVLREADAELARAAGATEPERVRAAAREALAGLMAEHRLDPRVTPFASELRRLLAELAPDAGTADCSGMAMERRYAPTEGGAGR